MYPTLKPVVKTSLPKRTTAALCSEVLDANGFTWKFRLNDDDNAFELWTNMQQKAQVAGGSNIFPPRASDGAPKWTQVNTVSVVFNVVGKFLTFQGLDSNHPDNVLGRPGLHQANSADGWSIELRLPETDGGADDDDGSNKQAANDAAAANEELLQSIMDMHERSSAFSDSSRQAQLKHFWALSTSMQISGQNDVASRRRFEGEVRGVMVRWWMRSEGWSEGLRRGGGVGRVRGSEWG
jgi:hypothetical protein